MSKELRVVIVGCGGISGAWFTVMRSLKGVKIVGLADIRTEAARKRQEEFGLASAVVGDDFKAVIRGTKPDIVFDCTVPEAHVDVVTGALRMGCHVLGEKPLADSMENARKMVAAAKKARRLYAVMQNRRYTPHIRAFTALLASGQLGELTTLNSDFYIGAHFGGFRDRMKHVLLLDMAIHTFDAARLVSGKDAVSVYCTEWNPKGSWYDHDASAAAIFRMTDGVLYNYRGSWCSEGLNTTWECDWRAMASSGSATWNGYDAYRAQAVATPGKFYSEMKDVPVPVSQKAKQGGHAGVIADFIKCVRKGVAPETNGADNIKSLAMVFGAIESARTGREVKIGA